MDIQYLSHEKYAELEKELEFLKSDRRKEVAEHLEYAKKLGDLSENAEYHAAREEQAEVEERIRHLEEILKNSSIIKEGGTGGHNVVTIGATFSVAKEGENKTYLYTIVGSEEANIAHGKISNMSPLGAALLGRKVGDKVKVSTPKGLISYSVTEIK
ncbi:MAG TPA: transcription elongation factor GreA [Candidatus Paceibacterota bacterium]